MKASLAIFLLLLVGLSQVGVSSVSADTSNEEFIQASWRFQGKTGKHSYFLEWTFGQGKFELKGYPPLYQEGRYRVIKTDRHKLTLELYEQSGNFGTENSTIEIVLNRRRGTLMIKGQGPFVRQLKN